MKAYFSQSKRLQEDVSPDLPEVFILQVNRLFKLKTYLPWVKTRDPAHGHITFDRVLLWHLFADKWENKYPSLSLSLIIIIINMPVGKPAASIFNFIIIPKKIFTKLNLRYFSSLSALCLRCLSVCVILNSSCMCAHACLHIQRPAYSLLCPNPKQLNDQ